MKTYIIIGRYWSPEHGYLATRSKKEIVAKNKTSAMKLLKQGLKDGSISRGGCNQWHHDEGSPSADESQREREYWDQDPLDEGDPEIRAGK